MVIFTEEILHEKLHFSSPWWTKVIKRPEPSQWCFYTLDVNSKHDLASNYAIFFITLNIYLPLLPPQNCYPLLQSYTNNLTKYLKHQNWETIMETIFLQKQIIKINKKENQSKWKYPERPKSYKFFHENFDIMVRFCDSFCCAIPKLFFKTWCKRSAESIL